MTKCCTCICMLTILSYWPNYMFMDYLLCERPGIIDQLSSVGCVNDLEMNTIKNKKIYQ